MSAAGLIPVWRYEASPHGSAAQASAPPPSPTSPSAPSPSSASSRVVAGPVVDTEKGPVQVEVTFEGNRIASVRMLRRPDHPQTTAAVPELVAETLRAQSADVDTVSGATVTSDGYRTSLQAAIDAKDS
ncbi:FMN-binding protein [Streptomyces sp. NPDC054842]